MIRKGYFAFLVLMAAFCCGQQAVAQNPLDNWSQATACPGWNNPANFGSGSTLNYYQARVGEPQSSSQASQASNIPNVLTAYTGMTWGQTYNRSAIGNVTSSTMGDCATVPNNTTNKPFVIMTTSTQVSGHPVNRDPMTGDQLPFVPTQFNTHDSTLSPLTTTNFTKSIRIGDACGGHNAAALYYYVDVTQDNAMFYIYYSIVVEVPSYIHGKACDPMFIIRVTQQNQAGQWVQASPTRPNLQTHNDSLSYYVSSTPATGSYTYGGPGSVVIGQDGWHDYNPQGYGNYRCFWKEWSKVAVNLSDYMFHPVRIEVMVADCCMTQHFAYGYIAGECRPMQITSSGCPPGLSTDVTTLAAPKGLLNYVWYKSDYGALTSEQFTDPRFSWTQLTPDAGPNNYNYGVQANDFHITRRMVNNVSQYCDTTVNWQTFRCKMTSALDPAKPVNSYLHVSVQNTKPSMIIDSLIMCDGTVKLWNRSQVPGNPSLVQPDQTRWQFFNNVECVGMPEREFTGDSVVTQFDSRTLHGLRVRTFTSDAGCYSDGIYRILPRQNPRAGMVISNRVLCDTAETELVDTTSGRNNYRRWYFRPQDAPDDDMSLVFTGDTQRVVSRSFTHFREPIEMVSGNGLYYLNPTNTADTIWCETTVRDSVSVFLHPNLLVTGDTVVCEGSLTNATVQALGVDGCDYQWSTTAGTITGNLPNGPTLRVVPYADTSTYYVQVTSPQGCVAWDSIHCYMVKPKLTIYPGDGRICPERQAVLVGSDADHYSWTASPADASLAGQEEADTIVVSPSVTTTYTMVGHGTNGCDATPLEKTVTIVPLPVPSVRTTPSFIDTDNPTVVLRDMSENGVTSSWLFNDGSVQQGREVRHRFTDVLGHDSIPVTLTSYNSLDCPTVYPFSIPVGVYTAWFPTVFTPGTNDGNGYFSFYTVNEYEYFHIYIYNRRGELVYESDDLHFRWDGTKDGEPCLQGTYVYTCRFRKPGTANLRSMQGTITLVR